MPARLPKNVKILRGTFRPHRDKDTPEVDPCEVPPPPEEMNEVQQRLWMEHKAAVELIRVFDMAMLPGFKALVNAAYQVVLADATGTFNTAVARTGQVYSAHLAAWGLRPADRERVRASPIPSPGDKDDEFTSGERS